MRNALAEDTLAAGDFQGESWSKSLDLFDYVRTYAGLSGNQAPPKDWSSDLRLNYINVSGVKLLYAGFAGASMGNASLIVPLQAFIESYKTRDGLDAVTASTFLMMLAFNDTGQSLYPDSPDEEDNLWASFSIGRNLEEFFVGSAPPRFSSGVEAIPLESSGDKREWTWGMSYRNLTAIWWRLNNEGGRPGYSLIPTALSVYDELAFSYRLVLDPAQGTAQLYLSYIIGEMRQLWVLSRIGFIPLVVHYNDTGAFAAGKKVSNASIHRFLADNGIKMSLVLFQRNLVIDHATSSTSGGQSVTDGSVDLSSGSVQTLADTGQKTYEVSFGEKKTYQLYNSTSGTTTSHEAVTRTADVERYVHNPVINVQTSLLKFLPKLVRMMVETENQNKVEEGLNVTRADYLYITSYPVFGGYKIVNDPLYTAYFKPAESGGSTVGSSSNSLPLLIVVGVAAAVVIFFVMKRR
jgi:hypothetical protein